MMSCLFITALWPPAGKGLTFWLSFAMFYCFLSLSHVVSWVRCGTRLYRFLILATFSYFATSYYGLGSLKPEASMGAKHFCASSTAESRANIWRKVFKPPPPPPLAKGAVRSKAVVLLLLISTPIVGSCYCSMFLRYFIHLLTYLLEIDGRLKQFCF